MFMKNKMETLKHLTVHVIATILVYFIVDVSSQELAEAIGQTGR
jgi:hypothetical protein